MSQTAAFSHIKNNLPAMVDVGGKSATTRIAVAVGSLFSSTIAELLKDEQFCTKKGPVFHTAIIAGTMAVKNTATLIPLCHPLTLEAIDFNVDVKLAAIEVRCSVKSTAGTGVEMEALTGVSVALLTIYDMCKSLSFDMTMGDIRLLKKTGGKNDGYEYGR